MWSYISFIHSYVLAVPLLVINK